MREMCLSEIQDASLLILKEIDRICVENGFVYWINAGTLIGAIRHGGFIPWDDDIDIAMPRSDYERFIDFVSKKYNNPAYELHTYWNNTKYPFYISRFCDTNHKLIFEDYDYESGCFVDIYPFDGMGKQNDIEYWKMNEKKLQSIQKDLKLAQCTTLFYGNSWVHKVGNLPRLLMSKIKGRNHYLDVLDNVRLKFSWDESDYVGVISWSTGTYTYPKNWFEKICRMKFENITVNVPCEYDEFLKAMYGDYMKLPDEDKRIPYHGYKAYFVE